MLMGKSLASLRVWERIVCLTNTHIILNITRSHVHFSFCNWTRMSIVGHFVGKILYQGSMLLFSNKAL